MKETAQVVHYSKLIIITEHNLRVCCGSGSSSVLDIFDSGSISNKENSQMPKSDVIFFNEPASIFTLISVSTAFFFNKRP